MIIFTRVCEEWSETLRYLVCVIQSRLTASNLWRVFQHRRIKEGIVIEEREDSKLGEGLVLSDVSSLSLSLSLSLYLSLSLFSPGEIDLNRSGSVRDPCIIDIKILLPRAILLDGMEV